MANVKFTEGQMEELRKSKYVMKVSPSLAHFSVAFKLEFWTLLCNGKQPRDIVMELGLDPEILGESRISGLKTIISNEAKSGKGFRDLTACYGNNHAYLTPDNRIRYLEQQLAYKDQEIEFLKKIVSIRSGGAKMMKVPAHAKYEIIQEMLGKEGNQLNLTWLCDAAGVSRSGYCHFVSTEEVRAYQYRGYKKGARSIYMRLLHLSPPVHMNLKKIRRLMKKYGLHCPIRQANPYKRMMKAMQTAHVAPNIVNREFEEHGPRMILLADITYIINGKTPRCYMSTIIDAYTKELLSWVLSPSLEIDFVLDTVQQLIQTHGTSLSSGTLIHSDQGSHYTSVKFIDLVNDVDPTGLTEPWTRGQLARGMGNLWERGTLIT